MLNLSINHVSSVSDEKVARVIHDALELAVKADMVCTYLCQVLVRMDNGEFKMLSVDDPLAKEILAKSNAGYAYKLINKTNLYNESVHVPLGMTQEDVLLEVVQRAVGTFNLDLLQVAAREGWFNTEHHKHMVTPGTTNVYLKFYHGLTLLTRFFEWVSIQNELDVKPFSEWVEVRDSLLSMGLGDTVYALKRICNVEELAEASVRGEEMSLDSCYSLLTAKHKIEPIKLANIVLNLSNKYVCVIPIFEQDPDTWNKICNTMDPALRESFVELGQYIFDLDIRAFNQGVLEFNEAYLGVLEERAERADSTLIATQFPGVWKKFQEKVPNVLVDWFLKVEPGLTVGLIDPIVKGAPINAAYIHLVRSQISGAPNTGIEEFDAFEGEKDLESETSHFKQ